MASLSRFDRSFTFNWYFAVLALLGILFFTKLGFWQLHRAEEKQHLLDSTRASKQLAMQEITSSQQRPTPYQPIAITGTVLPYTFLLDNQHFQHQIGFDIITPVELDNKEIILVDRGWVKRSQASIEKVSLKTPQPLTLHGYAYFPKKTLLLGSIFDKIQTSYSIIEAFDTKAIEAFLKKPVLPYILRLNRQEPFGFERNWPIVVLPPERHYGYAFQWFSMAFLVFVLFIGLSFRKKI